jgi:hypothetical protein
MLGSSWVAAQLAASQEGLSSMSEWVSEWVTCSDIAMVTWHPIIPSPSWTFPVHRTLGVQWERTQTQVGIRVETMQRWNARCEKNKRAVIILNINTVSEWTYGKQCVVKNAFRKRYSKYVLHWRRCPPHPQITLQFVTMTEWHSPFR